MKHINLDLLLILLWLAGVGQAAMRQPAEEALVAIPDVEVVSTDTDLHRAGGILYYGEEPFSGRLIERYDDGATKRVTPYYEGKAHGLAKGWYPGGMSMYERLYEAGEKEGLHTGWWEDGRLKFIYHFKNDLHEGNTQTWFRDGALYRDFNYEKRVLMGYWMLAGFVVMGCQSNQQASFDLPFYRDAEMTPE